MTNTSCNRHQGHHELLAHAGPLTQDPRIGPTSPNPALGAADWTPAPLATRVVDAAVPFMPLTPVSHVSETEQS